MIKILDKFEDFEKEREKKIMLDREFEKEKNPKIKDEKFDKMLGQQQRLLNVKKNCTKN